MSGASVTHISGGSWGARETSSPSCREAVLKALGGDRVLMARFARACSEGVPALVELGQPVRRAMQERGHCFESHAEQLEETIAALHDIAHKLMPASPGAALGRLRERVAERDGVPKDAVEAIEDLVAGGPDALGVVVEAARRASDEYALHAARLLYRELYRRGQRWEPGNFSTHIRAVMATLVPPPWDASWAAYERRRALLYICGRAADCDLPDLPNEYAEVFAAEDARDPERYRAAVRTLVRNAVRKLKREGRLFPEPGAASAAETERGGDPGSSAA
ncbi:MAG: hypothetical protein M3P49_06950 [Actinomycetota bacterium]|nr:hypothetical protein [Actinomycetota bacterium]